MIVSAHWNCSEALFYIFILDMSPTDYLDRLLYTFVDDTEV